METKEIQQSYRKLLDKTKRLLSNHHFSGRIRVEVEYKEGRPCRYVLAGDKKDFELLNSNIPSAQLQLRM